MYGHATGAGLPEISLGFAQAGKFLPCFTAVNRLEDGRVFHPGVSGIGIGERGFEVPDALEFPRMLGAIVPFVGAGVAFIDELVAFTFGKAAGAF